MQNPVNPSNTNAPRLPREEELLSILEELYGSFAEAQEALSAIRRGEVDAFLVSTDEGEKVYTLKTAEHPYRVLIEQMQEGAAILAPDGTILYSNASFARLVNVPLEKVMGQSFHAFVAPAGAAQFRGMMAAGNPSGSRGESALLVRGGGEVPVSLSLQVMPLDRMQAFSLVVTDLTEQKTAEVTLQRAHDSLEIRVGERTIELAQSNAMLQIEIEERRAVEVALRESEERFRLLTENASDVVLVLDRRGRIQYASPSVKPVGGYVPEDLVGRGVTELVHPDDLPLAINGLSDALARPGERISLEIRVRHTSGDWLYLDLIGVNLLNEPAVRGFVVNARDITKRKRAEEALQESENRFRLMGETVPYGVWLCAPDGGVRYCSQSFLDLLNMTQEEQQQFGWTERLMPGDVERTMAKWLGCCATGTPWEHEHRITDRDGRIHIILSKGLPVRDAEGAITCWVGVNLDITDRKRAEEALRQSEQSLAAELDAARRLQQVSTQLIQADRVEALYDQILDTAVTILHADFASIQMLDADRGTAGELRLLGHRGFTDEAARFWEWVRPDSESSCGKAFFTGQRVIVPDVRNCEFLAGSADREMYLQTGIRAVQTTPLYSRSGTLLGMLSTHWRRPHEPTANELRSVDLLARQAADLIDRKRAEDALRRHTEDLVRVGQEVEQARDEANIYLDVLTHDVRNANNVSSMYADLLIEMTEGDLKDYMEKLHASIDRSSEILGNVATIRRAQEEEGLAPVDLDAVIREEIATFPGAAIRYVDPEVSVLADGLLPTVFTNLIGNAVKHGGPDAVVTVRVEEQDGEVLVSVEDTGPGVPDAVKRKLFTRFERGMARGSGQGLGLFIVRTLVTRYGGRVRVEDRVPGRPEEGAAFRFTLRKAM